MNMREVLLICLSALIAIVGSSSKPLYIRIHETNVFTCPRHAGLTNRKYLVLNRESIKVTDYYNPGEEVPYIKLPGKYKLEFRNVRVVGKNLDYLVGDMSIKLRAKLYGSLAEAEVQVIPSEDPQNPGQKVCDKGGTVVEVDHSKDRFICRHCDLCTQSREIERDLESRKVIAQSNQQSFSTQCDHFKQGETYNLVRVIDLPDPDKAKDMITSNTNLLNTIQEAFAQGKGRMIVQLRLLTKPKSAKDEFCQKKCGDRSNFVCWRWSCEQDYEAQLTSGRLNSASSADECDKNGDKMELAGCYDVEFSYDASSENPSENQQSQTKSFGFSSFGGPAPANPGSEDICKGQPNWCRGCWWCGVEWCSSEACRRAGKRT